MHSLTAILLLLGVALNTAATPTSQSGGFSQNPNRVSPDIQELNTNVCTPIDPQRDQKHSLTVM